MALKIAIDTNRYVDFCKGEPEVTQFLRRVRQLYLPFIVIAELRAGFHSGNHSALNERTLIRFLNSERVTVLYPDEQTTHHYATVFSQLRSAGTPIPTNDLWIASLVIQHELILYTRDQHFSFVPQIPRL